MSSPTHDLTSRERTLPKVRGVFVYFYWFKIGQYSAIISHQSNSLDVTVSSFFSNWFVRLCQRVSLRTSHCASSVTTAAVPMPISTVAQSRCQGKYLANYQYLIPFLHWLLSFGPADTIKISPHRYTAMTRNNYLNIKEINNLKWANKLGPSF